MHKRVRKTFKDVKETYNDLDILKNDIKLVTSVKQHNYLEVLKHLEASKEIIIFTYSISNKLLEHLKQVEKSSNLHLVVNNLVLSEIETLEKILPENFNFSSMTLYLCPINHSKIIYTENISYIGSQNIGSWYKFEAGVVLKSSPSFYLHLKKQLKTLEEYSTVIKRAFRPEFIEVEKQNSILDVDLEDKANEYIWTEVKQKIQDAHTCLKKLKKYDFDEIKDLLQEIKTFLDSVNEWYPEDWIINDKLLKSLIIESNKIEKEKEKIKKQIYCLEDTKNSLEENIVELEEKIKDVDANEEDIESEIDNNSQKISEVEEQLDSFEDKFKEIENFEEKYNELYENLEFFKKGNIHSELKKTIKFWEYEGFITDYVNELDLKMEEQFTILEDAGIELATTKEKLKLTKILKEQHEYLIKKYKY